MAEITAELVAPVPPAGRSLPSGPSPEGDRRQTNRSLAVSPAGRQPAAVRHLFLAALLLVSCGRARGSVALWEPCRSDFDCAEGFCAGARGDRRCTITCGRDSECPEGWTCHGVTHSGVVVCARGEAVPIPH
jgi:hypothetical protein